MYQSVPLAKPSQKDARNTGFDGGEVGSELTVAIQFHANPAPEEILWYMHDLDGKPLKVDSQAINGARMSNDPMINITSINGTRYRWGNFTKVIKIISIFMFGLKTCSSLQDGNVYTTRLIIPELLSSDDEQTGKVTVRNAVGTTEYQFQFQNLTG